MGFGDTDLVLSTMMWGLGCLLEDDGLMRKRAVELEVAWPRTCGFRLMYAQILERIAYGPKKKMPRVSEAFKLLDVGLMV